MARWMRPTSTRSRSSPTSRSTSGRHRAGVRGGRDRGRDDTGSRGRLRLCGVRDQGGSRRGSSRRRRRSNARAGRHVRRDRDPLGRSSHSQCRRDDPDEARRGAQQGHVAARASPPRLLPRCARRSTSASVTTPARARVPKFPRDPREDDARWRRRNRARVSKRCARVRRPGPGQPGRRRSSARTVRGPS